MASGDLLDTYGQQVDQTADYWDQFDPTKASPTIPVDPGQGRIVPNPYAAGAPDPTKGAGTSGAPGSITDPNAFRDAWFASPYPKTVDGLKQFVAANPQFGAQITGSKGSKVLIGGQTFQAVRSAGIGGGIGPAWDPLGAGGGESSGGGSIAGLNGPLTTPYTGQFKMPTQAELEASPGYQARLATGLQGVERSAAARGTLLTGGTLKALDRYGQDFASNEMQNYFNQNFMNQSANRDIFYRNQDAPFSKLYNLASLGKP